MKIPTSVIRILVILGVFVFSSSVFSIAPGPETEMGQQGIHDTEDAAAGLIVGKGKGFGMRIAGTYLATRQTDAGPSRILSIFADGNLTSIQSIQFGGGALGSDWFSNQQGTWKRAGKHRIVATVFDLSYAAQTGEFLGTTLAHYDLLFDNTLQTVTGSVEGKIFGPGIDPLNPGEIQPIAEFTDNFEAQRVTVGD
jgi:hypothetical protein